MSTLLKAYGAKLTETLMKMGPGPIGPRAHWAKIPPPLLGQNTPPPLPCWANTCPNRPPKGGFINATTRVY